MIIIYVTQTVMTTGLLHALMACKDGQVINESAKYIWEAFNVRENILCP